MQAINIQSKLTPGVEKALGRPVPADEFEAANVLYCGILAQLEATDFRWSAEEFMTIVSRREDRFGQRPYFVNITQDPAIGIQLEYPWNFQAGDGVVSFAMLDYALIGEEFDFCFVRMHFDAIFIGELDGTLRDASWIEILDNNLAQLAKNRQNPLWHEFMAMAHRHI